MNDPVQSLITVLESYRGRDKVIRTLCYGSQLVGGVISQKTAGSSEMGKSLLLFSAQLSHCRTVLRLFDDLSMFAYSRSYGLGGTEADLGLRWMSVLTNVADQLYYPCEHVAWAADAELIRVKSDKWWTLSTFLWGLSLLLGILRSVRVLLLLKRRLKKTEGTRQIDSGVFPPSSEAHVSRRSEAQHQVRAEVLNILSSMADLSIAIHWMPPGFLWAGHFPNWLVGLLGTTSSLIGLYQMTSCERETAD
ncbi:peroxisomal membrane protein 11C isoform X2 [Anguilla rostrata]|uniref:peroxisomal membrane protein 11C isoform X2 n=1 Tax=Anguilla rostrata TaxID=7938 RepID=UPI0030CB322D